MHFFLRWLEFSYEIDGTRHYFSPMDANENGEQYAILSGDVDGFLVRCELRPRDSSVLDETVILDLLVNPYWAPRGASQFLALVRRGYYDGVGFNRVVPEFLVQFGIAKDVTLRNEWIGNTIPDDETYENYPQFEPGYVSFAGECHFLLTLERKQTFCRESQLEQFLSSCTEIPGSGPDSRTTEIFIVMPGASQEQLDYFGENSWETPFAVVQGDLEILTKIYSGYGDMPPWGSGELIFSFTCLFAEISTHINILVQVRTRLEYMTQMATSTSLKNSPAWIISIDAT